MCTTEKVVRYERYSEQGASLCQRNECRMSVQVKATTLVAPAIITYTFINMITLIFDADSFHGEMSISLLLAHT